MSVNLAATVHFVDDWSVRVLPLLRTLTPPLSALVSSLSFAWSQVWVDENWYEFPRHQIYAVAWRLSAVHWQFEHCSNRSATVEFCQFAASQVVCSCCVLHTVLVTDFSHKRRERGRRRQYYVPSSDPTQQYCTVYAYCLRDRHARRPITVYLYLFNSTSKIRLFHL
jgi:hypothetical protein